MNKRRAAYSNLAFSFGGLVVNVVGGLLFVPLYLRHIDDATYGAWLASGSVVSILGLFESGLATVFTQKLAVALSANDHPRIASLTGVSVAAALVVGLVVAVLGGIVALLAPQVFGCPPDHAAALRLAVGLSAFGSGLMMIAYTLGAIPQALQRTLQPGIIILSAMATGLVGTWFGILLGGGVTALGIGPVCTGLVMLMGHGINNARLWREFGLPRPAWNRDALHELVREARMLLLARISGSVTSNLQAPAAALTLAPEASTVMGLTWRIVSLVPLFVERVGTAVFAGVARISQQEPGRRVAVLREILTITTVLGGLGLGLALVFTQPLMTLWVGPQRYAGDLILVLFLVSALLAMRQGAHANLLTALGAISSTARWMTADALMRLGFIVILAPLAGLPGIPGANILSTAIVAVALAVLLRRETAIPVSEIWQMGGGGFTVSLFIGLAWWWLVPAPETWVSLAWQLAACGVCMLVLATLFDRAWRRALNNNLRAIHPGTKLFVRGYSTDDAA